MPYKDPRKIKQYWLDRRERVSLIILESKNKPCEICGIQYPSVCMEFHHRDPKDKKFKISTRGSACRNIDKLRDEIAKCMVVCSNCHRVEHWPEHQR